MPAAAAGLGNINEPFGRRVLLAIGHHDPTITIVLVASVITRSVVSLWAVLPSGTPVLALHTYLTAAGLILTSFGARAHRKGGCWREYEPDLTGGPQRAERRAASLRRHHTSRWDIIGYAGGAAVIAILLTTPASWAQHTPAKIAVTVLLLTVAAPFLRMNIDMVIHLRLYRWCRWCWRGRGDGSEPAPAPAPDPAGSVPAH